MAAATFIGAMGNIPVATVLSTNGVLFSGIMGFIYSDLMPPARGRECGILWLDNRPLHHRDHVRSIVAISLIANTTFTLVAWIPEGARQIVELTPFNIDYTFWMNVTSVAVVGGPSICAASTAGCMQAAMADTTTAKTNSLSHKRAVVYLFSALLIIGLIAFAVTGGVR